MVNTSLTAPKNNKTKMATTAAEVAVPELGLAMAAKGVMDSKSTKNTKGSSTNAGPIPVNSKTTVSRANGDVNVNVYGGSSGGGSYGGGHGTSSAGVRAGSSGGNDGSDIRKRPYFSSDNERKGQQKSIFWFAIFIHLIDGFLFGFARSGAALVTVGVAYICLACYIAWAYRGDMSHKNKLYVGIALALALPMILEIPAIAQAASKVTFFLAFSGVLLAIPIVPIFAGLTFTENEKITKWTRIYVMGWTIIAFVVILATYASTTQISKPVIKPADSIKFLTNTVGKSFISVKTSITTAFKNAVSQATGQPYDGQEESQVGIYVEDVKPVESRYNTGSNVFVEAKIRAVNVKETIPVNVICYIQNVRQGNVTPVMMPDVTDNYENIIDCDLGQLPEGSYEVKVRANFEFDSSSDISYTFVSSNIKSDQYERLNINPVTIATYTGGPVELGLPSLSQPLRIQTSQNGTAVIKSFLSNYPFGVSLVNKWPQGKVVRGLRYILDVPLEIKLSDCSRDPILKSEPDTTLNRNVYTFSINTSNAQDVFDAVTCRMQLENIQDLLGTNLKSVKTFAAKAKYEYAVEGSTYIIVEKVI